jgi:hypothetical protein
MQGRKFLFFSQAFSRLPYERCINRDFGFGRGSAALCYPLAAFQPRRPSCLEFQSPIGNRQSAIIAGFGCGHRAALCYPLRVEEAGATPLLRV